jgi:glutathione S-transferase
MGSRNGNAEYKENDPMKIWGRANSINVIKVLWCADECGLKYEREDVGGAFGGNDQKWYLDMNPNGVVPTIDVGGRIIWESNSAVRYLAAKHAAGTLWPTDPGLRSEADRWMDWQLSTIAEPMRHRLLGPDPHAAGEARHGGDRQGRRGGRQAVRPARRLARGPALRRGRPVHDG